MRRVPLLLCERGCRLQERRRSTPYKAPASWMPAVRAGGSRAELKNSDPAFRQQIFDVAEAQREPNIEPDRLLDDFGRKAIAAIADFAHRGWYGYRSVTASPPPT